MSLVETKTTKFDKEFKFLVGNCLEALKKFYEDELEQEKDVPDIKFLKLYCKFYWRSEAKKEDFAVKFGQDRDEFFFSTFAKIFTKRQKEFLKVDENDIFLEEGITIHLGNPDENNLWNDIKFPVSACFKAAKQIQQHYTHLTTQDIEEMEKNDDPDLKHMIRSSVILLHLTRIFYIVSNEENAELRTLILRIEDKLNIPLNERFINLAKSLPMMVSEESVDDFKKMAKSVIQTGTEFARNSMGINTEGISEPAIDNITNIMKNLFQDEGNRNMLVSAAETMRNSGNANDAISKLLPQFASKLGEIQKMFTAGMVEKQN